MNLIEIEINKNKQKLGYYLSIPNILINQLKERLVEYDTCIKKEGRKKGDDCVNIYKD